MRHIIVFASAGLLCASANAACPQPIDSAVAEAKRLISTKNGNAAFRLLTECRNELSTTDHRNTHRAALLAAQKEDKAAKKKQGVTVGMAEQEVLDSQWGRPTHINITQTSRGTRQQWVYGSGHYLYFEDGILQSIQTKK